MNNAARGNENALNNVTDIINRVLYFLILKFFFFSITEIIIFGMVSPNIIFLMLKYCYTNMMVTTSYNYKKINNLSK